MKPLRAHDLEPRTKLDDRQQTPDQNVADFPKLIAVIFVWHNWVLDCG